MIPEGWKRVPLETVADVRSGVAKGKSGLKDPITVPYLRVANVQDGHINLNEVKSLEIERHQLERYSLMPGDVLMNEGGDFDKLGRGDVWLGQVSPCLHQNHVFAVRPNQSKMDSFFLAALAASNYGKAYFLSCAKRSTNLASINSTQIKEFPVILPPLPEQKKIAKILSTWDKAITTTEQLLANSQQQKKALMQQLLTGNKRLKGFSKEWKEGTINSLVGKIYGGGTPPRNIPEFWGGNIPWVTVKDLISSTIHGAQEYINEKGLKSSATSLVPKGTVIIATRMAVGKAVVATCDVAINQDLKAVCDSEHICSGYLHYWFLLQSEQIEKMGTGSTVKGVQVETIKSLKLSIPASIEEQQAIAAVLSAADREIELLQQKLEGLKQEKKALMQQLLTGKRRVQA